MGAGQALQWQAGNFGHWDLWSWHRSAPSSLSFVSPQQSSPRFPSSVLSPTQVLSQAALCGGSRAFPDFSLLSNPHLRSPGANLDLMLWEIFSSLNDAVLSHPLLVSETFPPCWEGLRHSPLLLHLKTGQMEKIHGNSGFPFSREQFTRFSEEISEVQMFL